MAKRKNSNSSGRGASSPSIDLLKATNQGSSSRSLKVGTSGDLTRLQVGSLSRAKAIQFGSPSDSGKKNSSSNKTGSTWTGLLESFSTGGISDLLGGGGFLSSGLDYLSSGLQSIFGGNTQSAPEPLSRFAPPDFQDQTIYVNAPPTAHGAASSTVVSGAYADSQPSQLNQASRAEIVQTIKNALLTSSSLNDVIGEL
jgi:hypothetical protein